MSVNLVDILAAQKPGYFSKVISDLDTEDPRTQAVKRALAHYHNGVYAKYECTDFAKYGYITGHLKLDWDKSFTEIPACMMWFYYEAVRRCAAQRDTFEKAVMFMFDRLGHRIVLYREHCTDEQINEWIRQVIHDLYIEYDQRPEPLNLIQMSL